MDEFVKIMCEQHREMAVRKENDDGKCPHCGKKIIYW